MLGSRLACAIAGDPLRQGPNSCSRTCSPNTGTRRLTRFLGTEDTALSCSPVQDLDKKMLDEDEARL
jgi:hypothetical protein